MAKPTKPTAPAPALRSEPNTFSTRLEANILFWPTHLTYLDEGMTYLDDSLDEIVATALAGDLPPLTGKAGQFIRANAAEDGGEFRTPAQVLADIEAASVASVALKAPLASPALTGTPTAPTASVGTNTTQVATTALLKASLGGNTTTVDMASQSSADFTGIPAGVRTIRVLADQWSFAGNTFPRIQLGTAASVKDTSYDSGITSAFNNTVSSGSTTGGFEIRTLYPSYFYSGIMHLERLEAGSNVWLSSHVLGNGVSGAVFGGGRVELDAEVTRLRITRNGPDLFDFGFANISWSF